MNTHGRDVITRSISSAWSPRTLGMAVPALFHQHIKLAEGRNRLFDRSLHSFSVASVRLNRDSFSTTLFNRFDHGGSRAWRPLNM